MSRAITIGVFGSVSGIVTAVVGFLWFKLYYDFVIVQDYTVLGQNAPIVNPSLLEHPCIPASLNVHTGDLLIVLVWVTFILAMFLVLTLILCGVGLYGLGKVEGKAMGMASLVVGVIGAILAAALLLFGVVAGSSTPTFSEFVTPSLSISFPIQATILRSGVPNVNALLLGLGFIVVGITVIVMGVTLIKLREGLKSLRPSLVTGVLSDMKSDLLERVMIIVVTLGFLISFSIIAYAYIIFSNDVIIISTQKALWYYMLYYMLPK